MGSYLRGDFVNDKRRSQLGLAIEHLNAASQIVSDISSEEEDCMDNMPENLQSSDRYSIMEDAVSNLEDAESDIDSAIEHITSAING